MTKLGMYIQYPSIHKDDIQPTILGHFHGVPVRGWNPAATAARNLQMTRQRIAANGFITTNEELAEAA